MAIECEAAARFDRLTTDLAVLGELTALGVNEDVVALTRRAADDERRHAALCARAATRFGVPATPMVVTVPRLGSPELPRRLQILHEVVALSCVTEGVSVALLGAMLETTTDPELAETVRSILRDEIDHARIGWAVLACGLNETDRSYLSAALPAILAGTFPRELFSTDAPDTSADLGPWAILPRPRRRDVVVQALSSLVFPGLSRFGIDPAAGRSLLLRQTTQR